ncbi:MAG: transcription termination/antitermination protein NusG [Gammaproteobacteria bacterium WSBS_2016_MAG_OTU1]
MNEMMQSTEFEKQYITKWYAVQVLVGFEKAIKENLLDRIEEHDMKNRFGEILLPIEKILEIQNGKKKMVERKLYPGYLFLEIAVEDGDGGDKAKIRPECWHLVRRTRRVGNFITGSLSLKSDKEDMPAPLDVEVVEKIRRQMQDSIEVPVVRAQFVTGEHVRVKDGPFSDFSGSVDAVNLERNRLTVLVMVLGRSTPVELDFSQVDKI